MNPLESARWTTIITPRRRWFDLDLLDLWRYRDLILLFAWRDMTALYKQTLLGPLWFALQPLAITIVFTIVFGRIAQIPTDGKPAFLFYFSGVVCWSYFAANLVKTADTLVSNANIFGKVYFPRLTVPISVVISNLLQFAIQFCVLLCVLIWFSASGMPWQFTWAVATLPLLLFQMAALGLGSGILVSALTTRYRDIAFVVGHGVQLWMFATPVVYPLSQVPQRWQWVVALNPMTAIVEGFRNALLGGEAPQFVHVLSSVAVTVLLLVCGLLLFARVERTFMDTV
ncbi:MAG TPA: ABC transporter permease [Nitrospira sp.]|jgi:lipopolysaccharide transport system permease protein|nr:ABC transporter permease [Nitrospira sp.]